MSHTHSQKSKPIYLSVLPFLSRDRERDELELELELLDEPLDEEEPLLEELLELLELLSRLFLSRSRSERRSLSRLEDLSLSILRFSGDDSELERRPGITLKSIDFMDFVSFHFSD